MVTVEEFSRTVQVASYEVGANEKIKLSVLLRMAQETSEQHLGELGIGYERLKADGIVFLMTNYRLLIKRLPVHNDVLTIKTHPRGTVGVQFYRDFVVYANGEEIARIMQTSVSANPDTHKILRPKVFLAYNIFQDAKVPRKTGWTASRSRRGFHFWASGPSIIRTWISTTISTMRSMGTC